MRQKWRICGDVLLLVALVSCRRTPTPAPEHLSISVPYELDSLDPHARNTISNFAVLSHFYEPLVRTDARLKVQPCLARTWETPDPVTWIFHLEPTARFHSGRPIRARDVVSTIERLRENPRLEMRAYTVYISDVAEIDPLRVRIRTTRPLAALLNRLNFVRIIPEGATQKDLEARVDGTGPYRLAAYKRGEVVRMERFDRYWGNRVAFDHVDFSLNRSPEQAADDLASGRCQLVQSASRKLEEVINRSDRYELLVHGGLFMKYLAYDVARDVTPYCSESRNPFKQVLVRQAINMAIDRQEIASRLSPHTVPASQLVPHFVFGFNPNVAQTSPDLHKAKDLLRQAGFPDGFAVTLHVRQILGETGDLVAEQLARVGIRVEQRILPDHDFFEALDRRDASFYLTRLGCPTGEASFVLDSAIHTPDPTGSTGADNWGGYSNPEIDRAIEESAGVTDAGKRLSVLQRIMGSLMEELPWIPLYSDQEVYGIDRSIAWQPRYDSYIFAMEASPRRK
ncbi:MAG: hypothetical protein HYX75_15765 [Acidobacteria bacterium]|nr:hypothetical protein [Acidobacteriota bacterium]